MRKVVINLYLLIIIVIVYSYSLREARHIRGTRNGKGWQTLWKWLVVVQCFPSDGHNVLRTSPTKFNPSPGPQKKLKIHLPDQSLQCGLFLARWRLPCRLFQTPNPLRFPWKCSSCLQFLRRNCADVALSHFGLPSAAEMIKENIFIRITFSILMHN